MTAPGRALFLAGGAARAAGALGLLLWLAACTPPGWADPTEWFGGPTAPPERIAAAGASEPGPYPALGSVPGTAPRPSPQYQRDRNLQGLLADRENAGYTEERLTAERVDGPPPAVAPRPAAAPRAKPAGISSKPVPPGPAPAPPPRPAAPAVTAYGAALPPVAPPGPEPLAAPETGAEPGAGSRPELAARPGGWSTRGLLVGVIQFQDGSSSIDARDRRIVSDVVLLQQQRGGLIRVVGHASGRLRSPDPAAQRLAAFELSLGRARSVVLAMMQLGVDPETLRVVAAAADEPAYDESLPSGEAGNRRVEIFLEY